MISRSYEGIIPQVAANICLNHFPADSIAGDEVFVLTRSSHGVYPGVFQVYPGESRGE